MNAEFFHGLLSGSRNGGTFNCDGHEIDVAEDVVTLACKTVSGSDLNAEELDDVAHAFIGPYRNVTSTLCWGFFRLDNGDISIDVNVRVSPECRANTLAFAKANGQESIYAGATKEIIRTGGDGVAKLNPDPFCVARAAIQLLDGKFPAFDL